MFELDGRTAIVVGATGEIGAATSRMFAAQGANVLLGVARGEEQSAARLRDEIARVGRHVWVREVDVCSTTEVDDIVAAANELSGQVDILLANAGIARRARVSGLQDQLWQRVLDTNLAGAFRCFRAAPELRHVELIETPKVDLRQLSTDPIYPQVVFLHGSVAHYSDQNLEQETARLDPDLRDRLRPLLRDHPLIVVGYRGAERSIMVDLTSRRHRRRARLCPRDLLVRAQRAGRRSRRSRSPARRSHRHELSARRR